MTVIINSELLNSCTKIDPKRQKLSKLSKLKKKSFVSYLTKIQYVVHKMKKIVELDLIHCPENTTQQIVI